MHFIFYLLTHAFKKNVNTENMINSTAIVFLRPINSIMAIVINKPVDCQPFEKINSTIQNKETKMPTRKFSKCRV